MTTAKGKKKKTSPTQRSLAFLRAAGYRAAVVEHWNPFAGIRQDLFGIIDIVAVGGGRTKGVQTTTSTNLSSRVKKIEASEALADLQHAGWGIEVHGWRRPTKRRRQWTVTVVTI